MLTPKRICDIYSSSIVDKHVLIKKNIFDIYIVVFPMVHIKSFLKNEQRLRRLPSFHKTETAEVHKERLTISSLYCCHATVNEYIKMT